MKEMFHMNGTGVAEMSSGISDAINQRNPIEIGFGFNTEDYLFVGFDANGKPSVR
jgi:NAD(P)H-flavin reductase